MLNEPNVTIKMLPISVAAFTTPHLVRRHLPQYIPECTPDIVFVSGMAQGDYSSLSEEFGIPVLKGTRGLSSLPLLLSHLDDALENLSSTSPADVILQRMILAGLRKRMVETERDAVIGTRNFRLSSGLVIGIDVLPRIMAEVVDASTRPFDASMKVAKYYSQWADIIDIGATVSRRNPDRIAELTEEIRNLGVPVSIDSLDPKEILSAVDAGAEIVLSIDYGNVDVLSKLPEDVAIVCLPTNISAGMFSHNPVERAQKCHRLCNEIRQQGYSKILADPILEAPIRPGMTRSLVAFHHFRSLDQDTPFLAGLANVTEFVDTDTIGVNALLAFMGVELGISVFLSTEERHPTTGCIKELSSATQLAFLAKMADVPPKELGITAFAAKSSRYSVQSVVLDDTYKRVNNGRTSYTPDPKGCFRIGIHRLSGLILCEHHDMKGTILRFAAERSSLLVRELLEKGLIGTYEHAAYLGGELMKAEIALLVGHDFQQDEAWITEFSQSIGDEP